MHTTSNLAGCTRQASDLCGDDRENQAQDIVDEMDYDQIVSIARDIGVQAQDGDGSILDGALEEVFGHVLDNIAAYANSN